MGRLETEMQIKIASVAQSVFTHQLLANGLINKPTRFITPWLPLTETHHLGTTLPLYLVTFRSSLYLRVRLSDAEVSPILPR